ncbi:MAG TPA: protein kinase, partial [Thermoanaerobaculia bacterium]|nr:protein kinase [Thermoanaerobaculia bacterium]
MIGRTLQHYRVLAKLGEGGMGAVYRAYDAKLDREVALKLLPASVGADPLKRARFAVEARAAAALTHPHIATIHAIEEAEGELFIVMEAIEGRELKALIDAGPLEPSRALSLATQIAEGLQAAHQRGIVHRDVKPSNLMVTANDCVKITDFGLARVGAGVDLTRAGATLGTAAYMAPEQVRAEPVDSRADVWAFGVVLYEMLRGKRPFRGDSDAAVIYAILSDEPDLAGLPAGFAPVIARALAKDRDHRYPDMTQVLAALEMLGSSASPPRPEGCRPRLAVLPFVGLQRDPDLEFLGFALADQIIGSLSYVRGLVVRPSAAVRRYQAAPADPPTAGRELGVEYVLTGTYLSHANRIRLTLELVEAHSNDMVWRDLIEEEYDNVFALQDAAAARVLQGLEVRFSPDERTRMRADVPRDALAYEYYLRAVSYPASLEDNRLALEMLDKAVALDASFAPAHAEIGYRLYQTASYGLQGAAAERRALDACGRALSLNPDLLDALYQACFHAVNFGDHERALELVERIVRVAPDSADGPFTLSYLCRYTGLQQESVRAVERALELHPGNVRFRSAGFTYVYQRDYR